MKTQRKGNSIKQIISIAMILMFFACSLPVRAEASTQVYKYSVNVLKQNAYVTAAGTTYTYTEKTDTDTDKFYVYKITLPANGYIRIQTKSTETLSLYKTINKTADLGETDSLFDLSGKTMYFRALPKGTYYFYAEKGFQFKWTFVEASNPTNYCKAQATTLAANNKIAIVFNHGYEYDRWYKISVTQNKMVSVVLKSLDDSTPDFAVYDAKGHSVKCPVVSGSTYRTAALTKGTYFIRVKYDLDDIEDDYSLYTGRIWNLTWK